MGGGGGCGGCRRWLGVGAGWPRERLPWVGVGGLPWVRAGMQPWVYYGAIMVGWCQRGRRGAWAGMRPASS